MNKGLGLDVETTKVSDFFALLRATYILDFAYSVDVNCALSQAISEHYHLPNDKAEWQISTWQNAYSDRWLYEEPADRV